MKTRTIIPLIVIGCILLTPIGYAQQAANPQQTSKTTLTTIDFVDCTGRLPIKKTVQMPHEQWVALQKDMQEIRTANLPAKETFAAEVRILQTYHLVSDTVTPDQIYDRFYQTSTPHQRQTSLLPILSNSNINAMCAISFQMSSGTNVVLGLNSFINLIGFDIVSFHMGTITSSIQTIGLIQKTTPPGQYAGFMFGFLGYWFGTRQSVGVYTDLIAAGFTIITVWVPISK